MRGIRLTSLNVTHFRGISNPINFDLSAPLTLVFAPNGTGKTTMCEAAEWLLTGQVDRLKEGRDFDALALRSKFATESDSPSTSASLFIGNQQRFLSRTAQGQQSRAMFGQSESTVATCKPSELLSILAPAAAADEAHPLTAISLRQRWLKGTRFLSADALAALVDTDDETIERRTQVFADLLGIRHLLDAERQCEKYANELSARHRALSVLVSRQSAEIESLEASISTNETAGSNAGTSSTAEADAAALLLGREHFRQPGAPQDLDGFLGALTAVHRRQKHGLDVRAGAVMSVAGQWTSRVELEKNVNDGVAAEAKLVEALASLREKGTKVASHLASCTSSRDAANEESGALALAKSRLELLTSMLIATLFDSKGGNEQPQSLRMLTEDYPEYAWSTVARDQRRRVLEDLESKIKQQDGHREQRRLLDEELKVARASQPAEEYLASLRREATEAELRARNAISLLESTSQPIARLRAAVNDLLGHEHETHTSTCPTCSHDWGSSAALHSAMAATLAIAPEVIDLARAAADSASESERAVKKRLEEAMNVKSRTLALERDFARLNTAEEALQREIERAGLPENANQETTRASRVRLDVADALAALYAYRNSLAPSILLGEPAILPDDVLVSNLLDHLDIVFSSRNRAVQLQLADLVKEIDQATITRDQLRASYAAEQQTLREFQAAQQLRSTELATLRKTWDEAAPGVEWSDQALDDLKALLGTEAQRLSNAEGHIEAARASWATESKHIRLQELRKEIQPLLDRSAAMSGQIAAANRARAVFYEAYSTTSRKQVHDLSRVVNPLFARMHANRLFDRINLGESSDFLHWLAVAGDQKLDPGKDFSQGQRQDLALAIFLARARSLGGTFFLDEPVIHLDDLNRVGLLDVLRATVLENSQTLNLVITTSSRALARHLIEKFSGIGPLETPFGSAPPLRVLELDGNGRAGVRIGTSYPLH